MALTLYFHPLSSFSQKVLVALYENNTPFTPHILAFGDEAARAEFLRMWPLGKFPVLKDDAGHGHVLPETSIIIEYLDQEYPGPVSMLPQNKGKARQVRLWDRFFDLYVEIPMQKIVADTFRPEGQKDAIGVAQAKEQIKTAYDIIENGISGTWIVGDDFTMADCAAAPALLYANTLVPAHDHPKVAAYLKRLMNRPSFRRVLREAEPYVQNYPFAGEYRAAYGAIG